LTNRRPLRQYLKWRMSQHVKKADNKPLEWTGHLTSQLRHLRLLACHSGAEL